MMAFTTPSGSHAPRYALILLLLVCTLIYLKGLFGGFLFDDFPNIVDEPTFQAISRHEGSLESAIQASRAGPLHRPISASSFALDAYVFGLEPLAFKLHNLALHLLNGFLLYALARRLIPRLLPSADEPARRHLALFATALWLLHPLHVGSVLYIVQRMNLLSTLFTLLGLLCYAEGRMRMRQQQRGFALAAGGVTLFGLLAVLSKENGALLPLYALIVEAFCFRFGSSATPERRAIQWLFALLLYLPALLAGLYLLTHPQWLLNGYAGRDFTLAERLLSEARILCDYLRWIVLPLPHWMGMFHDDFAASTGFLHPPTTVLAILFLLAAVALAWRLRHTHPALAFATAWFLAGHSMESTLLPLELVFDHRNYLPMAGLILGTMCACYPWLRTHIPSRMLALGGATVAIALAATTATRADTWGDPLQLVLTEAANHPRSPRAQYEAGRMLVFTHAAGGDWHQGGHVATPYFERAKALDPTDLFSAVGLFQIYVLQQRRPVGAEMIRDLTYRLSHDNKASSGPVLTLMTAIAKGESTLTAEQVTKVVDAAMDNPYRGANHRAMILSNYGLYQAQVLHSVGNAIPLMLTAGELNPKDVLIQINLATLALAANRPDIAAEHLGNAVLLDTERGQHRRELATLAKQLHEQTSAPPTHPQ